MSPRKVKKKAPFAWIGELTQALGAIPKKDLIYVITILSTVLGSFKSCTISQEAKKDVDSTSVDVYILEKKFDMLSKDLLAHSAADARAIRRLRMQRALEAQKSILDDPRPLPEGPRPGLVRRLFGKIGSLFVGG